VSALAQQLPAVAAAVDGCCEQLGAIVDPRLIALCRQRITEIVDGAADQGELAGWRDSAEFAAVEKACLELAEYFCYSAQSVTDEHVAAVLSQLPPEHVLALTNALWASDAAARLATFLTSLDIREFHR
jgi:hypothetical protein